MMENLQYSFALNQIYNPQFAVISLDIDLQGAVDFDFNIQIVAIKDQQQIIVLIESRLRQQEKLLAIIQVGCGFRMELPSWEGMANDDHVTITKDFCAHLAMIAMGTLRGVLFAKTEGTPLRQFPLPLINVSDLFKNDLTVPFQQIPQPPTGQIV